MPKREDEYRAKGKDNLRYCHRHKRYYRADLSCQLCYFEESSQRKQSGESPRLRECPNCKRISLYWNEHHNIFECLNGKCKRRFTETEYHKISDYLNTGETKLARKQGYKSLNKCPQCGQGMLSWDSAKQQYECLNASCRRIFSQAEYIKITRHATRMSLLGRLTMFLGMPKMVSKLSFLRVKRTRTRRPSNTIGWRIRSLLRNRWFLVIVGLAIVFICIGYYPSLFGESSYARWIEIPVEAFGGILVLIGIFRGAHRRRMQLIRTLTILFVLFVGASSVYIYLDESGRIDQWLHRSSSEGTISGNIKKRIPSLVDTIGELNLQTPVPTATATLPRITPAPATNTSRVWIGGAYLVGGDGNAISLVNNPNARNPSWSQLVDFLRQDPTDQMKYAYNSFVCADFAKMLHNNAEKGGWKAAYVSVELSGYPDYYNLGIPANTGHALNAFQTSDRGLVYIDCTAPMVSSGSADKTVDVQVGRDYIPVSIFPQPGWESTWQSMGRVTEIEVVQW